MRLGNRLFLFVALAGCLSGCAALGTPTNTANWSPDQAVLSYADIAGSQITIHNIRNCDYRTTEDYEVRHYDRRIDLSQVQSVDFIVVPFAEIPSLAHTMLSFGVDDGTQIALSVEVRKRVGDTYQPVLAMLPMYEIMYVIGDERDLVRLRSNYRMDGVYLYPTKATPEQAQQMFANVLRRANKLRDNPEFYNTITNNCTTNIRQHINELVPDRVPYGWDVLLPGHSDRLAYNLGLLDTTLSFEQAREQARVNYLAYLYRDSPDLSRHIREGQESTRLARQSAAGPR